jgi:trehalose-6-phosphatase
LNVTPFQYAQCRKTLGKPASVAISEFAGASSILKGAVRINPFAIDDSADALADILRQTTQEKEDRSQAILDAMAAVDGYLPWSKALITELADIWDRGRPVTGPAKPLRLDLIKSRIAQARGMPVVTSTVTPAITSASSAMINQRPSLFVIDLDSTRVADDSASTQALAASLRDLSRLPSVLVILFSHQDRATLSNCFQGVPVSLIAEAGAFLRPASASNTDNWVRYDASISMPAFDGANPNIKDAPVMSTTKDNVELSLDRGQQPLDASRTALQQVMAPIKYFHRRMPGSEVHIREYTAGLYTPDIEPAGIDPGFMASQMRMLLATLAEFVSVLPLSIQSRDDGLQVVPTCINPGSSLEHVLMLEHIANASVPSSIAEYGMVVAISKNDEAGASLFRFLEDIVDRNESAALHEPAAKGRHGSGNAVGLRKRVQSQRSFTLPLIQSLQSYAADQYPSHRKHTSQGSVVSIMDVPQPDLETDMGSMQISGELTESVADKNLAVGPHGRLTSDAALHFEEGRTPASDDPKLHRRSTSLNSPAAEAESTSAVLRSTSLRHPPGHGRMSPEARWFVGEPTGMFTPPANNRLRFFEGPSLSIARIRTTDATTGMTAPPMQSPLPDLLRSKTGRLTGGEGISGSGDTLSPGRPSDAAGRQQVPVEKCALFLTTCLPHTSSLAPYVIPSVVKDTPSGSQDIQKMLADLIRQL